MAEEKEIEAGEPEVLDADATETGSESVPEASVADDAPAETASSGEEAPAETASSDAEAPAETASSDQEAPAKEQPKRRARARKKTPAHKVLTPEERRALAAETRRKKAIARRAQRLTARGKYQAAEHERQATPPREHVPGAQKTRQGVVVSDRAAKTITVRIDIARRHRRYEKVVRTSNTVHAHDARDEAHIGDTVLVRESRPLSRTKRWRLVRVLERAK
jgi:small subunit ribosomal protein S17